MKLEEINIVKKLENAKHIHILENAKHIISIMLAELGWLNLFNKLGVGKRLYDWRSIYEVEIVPD